MSNPYAPPQPPRPPAEGEQRPDTPPQPDQPQPDQPQHGPAQQGHASSGQQPGSAPPSGGWTVPPYLQTPPQGPVSQEPASHGQTPPHEPGQARPVDAAGVARARGIARTFAFLVLAGVLTGLFPVPWSGVSLVFAAAAIVVGIRALVVALRAGARGSLPVMLGVATASAAGWLVISLALTLLWPLQIERQDCLAGALTLTAQQRCEIAFEQGVKDWRTEFEERTRP
ncbi:hypothetical protein [Cellulomonas composti]|uniref:Uncharacterized protein n=1 Tax=Cellulomonas composti TaxID=266130 RepID=A0A511J9V1_9CELL|nr:hypothetical protein [Cellulomonas composti]GEL94539.1 hypothetical protein CCO02nite_11970 [Cellulomonas composti]